MDIFIAVVGFSIGLVIGGVIGILNSSRTAPKQIDPNHDHQYGPWYDYLYSFQRRKCVICNQIVERVIKHRL